MDVVERNSMPSAVAGKKVTAFMRNGVPLCAAFQQQSCLLSERECSAAHRCAIVLRTGRACGGHHAAVSCYDKRAVLQETPSEPQSVKQPSPKPAMLQSKPKPKARPRQSASSQSGPVGGFVLARYAGGRHHKGEQCSRAATSRPSESHGG